jgi:DNA-binding response OmpR family regulator
MTANYLTESGYYVGGPFHSTAEAMPDAATGAYDAAVLDVNLRGELVYPVADVLANRNIPIIFLSGYGCDAIDPRFAKLPVINKPIQLSDLGQELSKICRPVLRS